MAQRFSGNSVSPSQYSLMKEKMNTIKNQRPITTSIHSRKSSRSKKDRSISFRRRNSDEAIDVPSAREQNSKLVSISELMKNNRKNGIIKIDTINEEMQNYSAEKTKVH